MNAAAAVKKAKLGSTRVPSILNADTVGVYEELVEEFSSKIVLNSIDHEMLARIARLRWEIDCLSQSIDENGLTTSSESVRKETGQVVTRKLLRANPEVAMRNGLWKELRSCENSMQRRLETGRPAGRGNSFAELNGDDDDDE